MRLTFPALALLGTVAAGATTAAQPHVDATRTTRSVDEALLFVPEPAQLAHGAFGYEEPLASLFWVRTVLVYGDRYDTATGSPWITWLRKMLAATSALDPTWRTPYYYGGTLLRAIGDIDGSDEVFASGHANLPDDAFFPFSLGMNAYLHHEDPRSAARYLAVAAATPGAPSWYAAAAAAMKRESGERLAGIRYLEEVLASTTDPKTRADTEVQLGRLRHDEVVDAWDDACRERMAAGRPLASPKELVAMGFSVPPNPRGDAWIVGADGVVRSAGAEEERVQKRRREEWRLVGR